MGTGDGQFQNPQSIAVDQNGFIYVADVSNHRIQKFDSNGTYITQWGSLGSGDGQFGYPAGVAVDSQGNVYVADRDNNRIQKFTSSGLYVTKWGTPGTGNGQFDVPYGLAVDSSDKVYVVEFRNHRVQVFSSTGTFITKWGTYGADDGQLDYPYRIAIALSGNVYITEYYNKRVQKFSGNGNFLIRLGSSGTGDGQFTGPSGITLDADGNVLITDKDNHNIQKFKSNGEFLDRWGFQGSNDGQLQSPWGIAAIPSGDVIVVDYGNNRIQKFSPTNRVMLTATPGINSIFSGWSGACTGTGPCTVTMDAAKNITATFNEPTSPSAPQCPSVVSVSAGGYYPTNVPTNAFDCDDNTIWNSGGWSGTITADFGVSVRFSGVVLTVGASPANNETYSLFGSDDGVNFTPITTASRYVSDPLLQTLDAITFDPVVSRYLRIEANGGSSWVAINEVRLLNYVTPAQGVAMTAGNISVVKGEARQASVTLTSVGGFNSAMDLASAWQGNAPANATVNITPANLTPTPAGVSANVSVTSDASTAMGSYTLRVTASGGDATAFADIQVTVANPLAFSTVASMSGVKGQTLAPIVTAGGIGAPTFIVASGALPPGVTFNPDGTFSGTPTTRGTYTFTVKASDKDGYDAVRQYSVQVYDPAYRHLVFLRRRHGMF